MPAWIEIIAPEDATGDLAECYAQVRTPHGTVDNVMRAHSLRPHTMAGHVALYRSVMHNPANTLPVWFLEAVATYVSLLNHCHYATAHHSSNMRRLCADETRGHVIHAALACDRPGDAFEGRELALLRYARKVTVDIGAMQREDVDVLREHGVGDGEILEVNQVCAYFAFSNRLLNGLGVDTEGDTIGYYAPREAGR